MCQPNYSTAQPIRASLVVEADAPFDLAPGSPISVDVNGKLMTIVVPDCGVKAGEHFTAHTVNSGMTPSTSVASLASAASDVTCDYSYSYFSAPSGERNMFSTTETYTPAMTTKRTDCTTEFPPKTIINEPDDDEYAYTYCT